jgi:hypothetical protein
MGAFTGCNSHLGPNVVSAFPLLQMIPAYVLYAIGVTPGRLVGVLAWLDATVTLAFVGSVLYWCRRRGGVGLAVVAGLLLIPGMLIPYTAQAFGEPLAVAAFGGLCLAALRRDRTSYWLMPCAFAAAISKDTAVPFVIVFGLAGIALSGCGRRTARRSALALLTGAVVGGIASLALNIFRYGTLKNPVYLSYPRASMSMAANSFAGQLYSPNGGILWFWPGVGIAAAVLVVVLIRGSRFTIGSRRARVGAGLALAGFVGSVGALSLWWQPYGWYAWGPRLLMPICPAVIVLALATISTRRTLRYWISAPALTGLAIIGVLAMAPAIGVVFDHRAYTAQVIATWKARPQCAPQPRRLPYNRANTESCLRFSVWERKAMPLFEAVQPRAVERRQYWITFLSASAAVLAWSVIAGGQRRGASTVGDDEPDDSLEGGEVPDGTRVLI